MPENQASKIQRRPVEIVQSIAAWDSEELIDALNDLRTEDERHFLIFGDEGQTEIDVQLVAETLSDGSKVHSIKLQPAAYEQKMLDAFYRDTELCKKTTTEK